MTTYISTSTDGVEMIMLDEGQEAYLDQIIAIDGRDTVVLAEDPVRNGSGRIIGSHLTVLPETWQAILDAETAAADDEEARGEQGAEEEARDQAMVALQEAAVRLDWATSQLAEATSQAGAARTAVDDARQARDDAIRAALDAGVTGYRIAQTGILSESQISRIASRR